MKKNKVLASTLALAILANTALPATKIAKNININNIAYASENPADINEAKEKLDYLGDLITSIENIAGGLAGNQLSWLKELKHAYELLSKIVNKGIGSASELRNRLIPRIDLLINVAETITADATELADSQQEAHVIVGFSVTRALLKATDLFENADGLNKASANLNEALDRARKVPKLTDESKEPTILLNSLIEL